MPQNHESRLPCDPQTLGFPVRRPRVYVFGCRKYLASSAELAAARKILEQLKGNEQMFSCEDILACPGRSCSATARVPVRRNLKQKTLSGKTLRWEKKAVDVMLSCSSGQGGSLVRSKTQDLNDILGSAAEQLSEREKAVLHSSICFRDGLLRFCDVSQNPGRAGLGLDIVPCITPHAKIFDLKTKTFLSARQKMACQGIFPQQPERKDETILEENIAGNAFNYAAFVAIFFSGMTALGQAACKT
jgi:hypothetical protein